MKAWDFLRALKEKVFGNISLTERYFQCYFAISLCTFCACLSPSNLQRLSEEKLKKKKKIHATTRKVILAFL